MAEAPVSNCEEIQESLGAYLLGELPESWTDAIDEHLAAGCPNCNDELDELLAGLSGVAAVLDGPPLKPEECIPVQRAIEQRILSLSASNRAPQSHTGFRFLGASLYAAALAAGVLLAVGMMRQFVPSKAGPRFVARQADEVRQAANSSPRISFVSSALPETSQESSQTILLLFDEQSREAHLYFRNVPVPAPGKHYVIVARGGRRQSEPPQRVYIDGYGQGQIVISSIEKSEAASLRLELRADESATNEDSI